MQSRNMSKEPIYVQYAHQLARVFILQNLSLNRCLNLSCKFLLVPLERALLCLDNEHWPVYEGEIALKLYAYKCKAILAAQPFFC